MGLISFEIVTYLKSMNKTEESFFLGGSPGILLPAKPLCLQKKIEKAWSVH